MAHRFGPLQPLSFMILAHITAAAAIPVSFCFVPALVVLALLIAVRPILMIGNIIEVAVARMVP